MKVIINSEPIDCIGVQSYNISTSTVLMSFDIKYESFFIKNQKTKFDIVTRTFMTSGCHISLLDFDYSNNIINIRFIYDKIRVFNKSEMRDELIDFILEDKDEDLS